MLTACTLCKINCLLASIYADVGFFLYGSLLSNNSMVLLRDIGEGSSALYCLTDTKQCCLSASQGGWRFPNDSCAHEDDPNADLYLVRGFSSLLLNRRSSAVEPTGVYTCLIPDSSNSSRNVYIGVYTRSIEGGSY